MAKRFLAALATAVLGLTVTTQIEPSSEPAFEPAGFPAKVVAQLTKLGNLPLVVDPFIQQAKLIGSDSGALDEFGTAVAMSGDTIVVGAIRGNGAVADSGAAYVFVRPTSGWSGNLLETAKLIASDGALNNQFGFFVAIDGDTVVVGTSVGAAYVFEKPAVGWSGTLTENAKLVASESGNSYFAVAVSGDTVVAGSQNKDFPTGFEQGAAYVFVKPMAGWSGVLNESARLTASDGAGGDFFGFSVAMTANAIVVGAVQDDAGLVDSGAAYVFVEPALGWSGLLNESAKLVASDRAFGDALGWSVGLNGDTIVAGAPRVGGLNNGAAYVFEKPAGGWNGTLVEAAKLVGSDGGGNLGASVAISGNTVVAGAYVDTANAGKAYIFMRPPGGWSVVLTQSQIIPAPAPSSGSVFSPRFGASAAASGGTLVISESRERVGSNNSQGAVYIFMGPEADLSLSKVVTPDAVHPGEEVTYTITATNNGPDDAASVIVTDDLPPEVTFASCHSTGGGSCSGSGNNQTVAFASLAAGASETITILATVNTATADGTDVSNTASVASAANDPNAGNDFSTDSFAVIHQADLTISKMASSDLVIAGGNLTYTIGVTNNGPNPASAVTVADILPMQLSFVSCSATGAGVCGGAGNDRTVSFASLAAGGSETITIETTVSAATPDGATVSNTASATSATLDTNPANNSAAVTTTVINRADLVTTKTASPAMAQVGTTVTYIVTVANTGPSSALDVTLTDPLPAGTTFVSNSGALGWTCSNPAVGASGTISCSAAGLASGTAAAFTIVVTIGCGSADGAVIGQTATAGSVTLDPAPSNNAATATVTALNPAPTLSASVTTGSLPAMQNPGLVNVGLSATTSDGVCPVPAVSSVEVFSDEDDETPSAPNQLFSPDARDIGVGTLRLRAERVRSLDGRVYLIVVRSIDAGGGVGFATTTVVVPRNASPSSASSVNAQAAAAKAFADGNNGNPPPGYFVIGDGPIIGPLQ